MQFNMSKAFIKQKAIFETTTDLNVMNVQDIYIGVKKNQGSTTMFLFDLYCLTHLKPN